MVTNHIAKVKKNYFKEKTHGTEMQLSQNVKMTGYYRLTFKPVSGVKYASLMSFFKGSMALEFFLEP
jgi:hypothetical protein